MAYFGKLLSNDLLMHAIRSANGTLRDGQGRPLTLTTMRMQEDGSIPKNGGEYHRAKRRRLFKHNPLCHWCHQPMVLIERGPGKPNVKVNPDEATIEHLDARHSPERGKHPGEVRQVLAHHRCNNERDRQQTAALPIQTLWERSGQIIDIARRAGALQGEIS